MSDPTNTIRAINKLFSAFPPLPAEDGDERLRRYLEVATEFAPDVLDAGVDLCVKGKLPGHDGRFVPTPPMLATACRLAAEYAARQRYVDKFATPALPPPDVVKTPEQRARALAMVNQFVAQQTELIEGETSEQAKRRQERYAKVNARFKPDLSEAAVMERLLGYSTGSPESEEHAA